MTEKILLALFSAMLSNLALLFVMAKILNKKQQLKSVKYVVISFILSIISTIFYLITDNFIRVIIYYFFLVLGSNYLFQEKKNIIIFASFLSYFMLGISEIFIALMLSLFINSRQQLLNQYALNIAVAILIFTVTMLLASNKRIIAFFQKIIDLLKNVVVTRIIISSIIGIFLAFVILYCSYFNLPIKYLLATDILVIACYIYTTYAYFKEINLNVCMKKEYDDLLINITEYERMYNVQKMHNHEHKNQLLMIKTLVNKRNHKLINYIDGIIKENYNEDNNWFNRLQFIPNNGIRGILYYKILEMKEKNINVTFIPSRDIKSQLLSHIPLDTNIKLCKILGVILDNAIDAVNKEKEKNILITTYLEGNSIVISVSNNFSGNVDFSKMGCRGFTTKGKNHGYGLSLVRYLVNNDNNLENYREINGNIFKQVIKINNIH